MKRAAPAPDCFRRAAFHEPMKQIRKHSLPILLAEDDRMVREALRELLLSEGFRIFEAASGLAALELIQHEKLAFSIMDVDMPGMTGIEVLRIVRREVGPLPCIFITGDPSRQRQTEALEVGAFSMLSKPIAPDLLRFSVQRLIDHYFRSSR